MRLIVWMSKPLAQTLCDRLDDEPIVVGSAREFIEAQRDARTVSFIDQSTLASLDRVAAELVAPADQPTPPELRRLIASVSVGCVIAVCAEPQATAIGWLPSHPWLSHVISAAMLQQPNAKDYLANVLASVSASDLRLLDWMKPSRAGRRVQLTSATRGTKRLDKLDEFFASHSVSPQSITALHVAADELLVNAFYVAPVEAGAESRPIPRTLDVSLPDELACEIAYGVREDGLAMVRVRDPFGALARNKLVDAVVRRPYGDATTGFAKVLALAPVVAISVVANHHTEVLIGVPSRKTSDRAQFAFHFFSKGGARRGIWKASEEDTRTPSLNASVTITLVNE